MPVIAWPGESLPAGAVRFITIGLTETIARNEEEYVELAASLAEDPPRLAAIRCGLRDRMAASPLCDGQQFASDLIALLRDVWRPWAAQSG